MNPPSFKPVSLSLSRISSILKHEKKIFLQVAELNAVLALVLSLILRGAATFLCIKDRIDSSEDWNLDTSVISNALKSIERSCTYVYSKFNLFTYPSTTQIEPCTKTELFLLFHIK